MSLGSKVCPFSLLFAIEPVYSYTPSWTELGLYSSFLLLLAFFLDTYNKYLLFVVGCSYPLLVMLLSCTPLLKLVAFHLLSGCSDAVGISSLNLSTFLVAESVGIWTYSYYYICTSIALIRFWTELTGGRTTPEVPHGS